MASAFKKSLCERSLLLEVAVHMGLVLVLFQHFLVLCKSGVGADGLVTLEKGGVKFGTGILLGKQVGMRKKDAHAINIQTTKNNPARRRRPQLCNPHLDGGHNNPLNDVSNKGSQLFLCLSVNPLILEA